MLERYRRLPTAGLPLAPIAASMSSSYVDRMGAITRREMMRRTALGSVGLALGCSDADLVPEPVSADNTAHLLPTASSDRILLKASFIEPLQETPELLVSGRTVRGRQTDTEGHFFCFDAAGLEPDREYRLELRSGGAVQSEPWKIKTLPAPDASPPRLRILAFTCAGGHERLPIHLSTAYRRRMLRRALSFKPDVAVVNGDHVYWDLTLGVSPLILGKSPTAIEIAGMFDPSSPVLGTANEGVLRKAVDNQIAELYGTLFKSTPVFFLRDDHDYFENDEYREGPPRAFTFPPSPFSVELARATQALYYPEFIADDSQPRRLTGSGASDRLTGTNESFGTLRYGRLFEGLLYDCKGFISFGGEAARVLPPDVENWLVTRMNDSDATHLFNMPSNPPGYSAGKFLEWYPDVLADGQLTTAVPKPGWQSGWLDQHDRLLKAASEMNRRAIFVSGDIHSHAEATVLRSRDSDFSTNPVISIITGTPGTTGAGWPSAFRGTKAAPSSIPEVQEELAAVEENGFNIIDVEPEGVTVRTFRHDGTGAAESLLDALEPFRVREFGRI